MAEFVKIIIKMVFQVVRAMGDSPVVESRGLSGRSYLADPFSYFRWYNKVHAMYCHGVHIKDILLLIEKSNP